MTNVIVARTVSEVETLRPILAAANWYRPDPDIDFFLTFVSARPQSRRPHVVVATRAGTSAVAVARAERIRLHTSVGYRTVYQPAVRAITLVHSGISEPDDESACRTLLGELGRALADGHADILLLPALRTDSALYREAVRLGGFLRRAHFTDRDTHRRLTLPPSFDEFLSSRGRKTRESIKRYRNRFLRAFGDDVSFGVRRDPADIDRVFRDLEHVAAKTYQRGLGVAFADTDEQRELVRLGLDRGWFRAYVLYVRDVPIAFWPGYAYAGTFFIGTPGYDPEYVEYRVGLHVQMKLIEDLCRDPEIQALDYGFGDSEYKRRYGNEAWEEADVALYAPTFRGVRVNMLRTAILGAARTAKTALAATQLEDRVKRRWRERLRPANK